MALPSTQSQRLQLVIFISLCFFIAEITGNATTPIVPVRQSPPDCCNLVGFYTRSLALVADAFHYVRDPVLLCPRILRG